MLTLAFSAEPGGAERSTLEAAAALDRSRFEPILAVPAEGPLTEMARARGVEVFLDRSPHLGPLPAMAWAAVVGRLARFVRERGVRLVHAGTLWRLNRAAALATWTRTPALAHVRDLEPERFRGLPFRVAASRMRRLVAISDALARELIASGQPPARVATLHNGIDLERFGGPGAEVRERALAARARWGVDADAPVAGLVGSIEPRKGTVEFLRAARAVADRVPGARFVVVGGDAHGSWGDYRREVDAAIAELGLGERVVLPGPVDDVAASGTMAAIDVLAVPSRSEPFGRVAVEAMAAGRPVVASRVGGLPEIVVDGETGALVDPGDREGLARALGDLLLDPALCARLGAAGRERAGRELSLARHVAGLEALYAEALSSENLSSEVLPSEVLAADAPAAAAPGAGPPAGEGTGG